MDATSRLASLIVFMAGLRGLTHARGCCRYPFFGAVRHAALRHPEIMKMVMRYHDASGLTSDRRSFSVWCFEPAEQKLGHRVTLEPRQDAA